MYQTKQDTGIEGVACANGAHGFDARHGVVFAKCMCAQGNLTICRSADERRSVVLQLFVVNLIRLGQSENVAEILVRAAYDAGGFEILYHVGHQVDEVLSVIGAEVGVVINDSSLLLCLFQ